MHPLHQSLTYWTGSCAAEVYRMVLNSDKVQVSTVAGIPHARTTVVVAGSPTYSEAYTDRHITDTVLQDQLSVLLCRQPLQNVPLLSQDVLPTALLHGPMPWYLARTASLDCVAALLHAA
jgi:hypothetical protein